MKQLRTQTTSPTGVIVIFPYSSNLKVTAASVRPVLSVFSKMSLDGAVKLWREHQEMSLLIPGETCYEGLADTTDLMIQRACEAGVPPTKLLGLHSLADGTPLNNTWLQAHALAMRLRQEDVAPSQVRIVGLKYHLERIRRACEAYGVHASYIAAETALGEDLGAYERYLPFIGKLRRSEAALRLYGKLDRRGVITSFFTSKIVGARQVDVVAGTEDRLRLENQTAAKRLATAQTELYLREPAVRAGGLGRT